jgi:two-component system, LuxR family, sensor histidine kinase DctS
MAVVPSSIPPVGPDTPTRAASWVGLRAVGQHLQHAGRRLWQATGGRWRRGSLWLLLFALVGLLVGTVVWLGGRYEASQLLAQVERDAADATEQLRSALHRQGQDLLAIHADQPNVDGWHSQAQVALRAQRAWAQVEWRSDSLALRARSHSPYRDIVLDPAHTDTRMNHVALACANARRLGSAAFAPSYYVPLAAGTGLEVMDMCVPLVRRPAANGTNSSQGFLVATLVLSDALRELLGSRVDSGQEISLNEVDGSRLAVMGSNRRGGRVFSAQQLLDLPGNTLVLRIDAWRHAPDQTPNAFTALVTLLLVALVSVVVMLAKDTRRRQHVEEELAESLAFRKAMEDSLTTGLRARDLGGTLTYVNPAFCRMVGFSAGELVGQGAPAPYWPPELADEYQQRQAVRLAGHTPPREGYETVFMRKDGSRIAVLLIEAPLINAVGKQTGWMSACLDITEQRRAEEQSRSSHERLQATARLAMVGEMASLLSHELNQPLAAIASYAQGCLNLLDTPPPRHPSAPASLPAPHGLGDDIHQALARIAEQAERAGKVIKGVHDLARRREYSREAVPVASLLDGVRPLALLQARKLEVALHWQTAPDLPPVQCERTMVEQVLLNLIRNGIQAMEHTALHERDLRVQVQRHGRDPWLTFTVIDRGPGIAPDVAQRLFTPFFTTRVDGMGLGLSLCRTVIEQHGGALEFVSHTRGLQRGSSFTFTLPLANGPRAVGRSNQATS